MANVSIPLIDNDLYSGSFLSNSLSITKIVYKPKESIDGKLDIRYKIENDIDIFWERSDSF